MPVYDKRIHLHDLHQCVVFTFTVKDIQRRERETNPVCVHMHLKKRMFCCYCSNLAQRHCQAKQKLIQHICLSFYY